MKKREKTKERKEKKPMSKKKFLLVGFVVLIISILSGVLFYILKSRNVTSLDFGRETGGKQQGEMGLDVQNLVTVSGVTSMDVVTEDFEVTDLTKGLYVEEVYVSSGTEVQEGTALLKFSQESVQNAREELESAKQEAELAYRAGRIEYEQKQITLRYDYDLAVLKGEQAKAVYEESISRLSDGVVKAQENLQETKDLIAEYEAAIAEDTYAITYPYAEKKALYDENLSVLMAKMEEWGVGWESVTNGRGGNQYATVLQGLYSVLEQNLRDYEETKEKYDNAVEEAQIQLKKQKLQLAGLETALANAEMEKQEGLLSAKLTYETALANAQQAEKNYDASLEQATAEYEELLETKEETEENLKLFEETVGDGYFYASQSGNVVRMNCRAGNYLQSDSAVLSYSDASRVTITLSVSQDSIGKIAVDDSAVVLDSSGTMWQAVVMEINPVSSSSSRTSVTYSVVVKLVGNTENISAGSQVTVIFGMGGMTNEKNN